ncbi:MAG: hypothetical protein M5U29_17275 [Anaerolineae bacterium]|nr:hypothetical protein [Anaerolineae bacterium]
MGKVRLVSLIVILALAYLAGGVASPAAAAQGATIQGITLNGCFIDVVFQVEDAGEYYVNFWDDGIFRAGAGGTFPANAVVTVRYVIGDPILEGAPGIGIYVQDAFGPSAATTYDADGNYAVPASVGDSCAALHDTSASVLNVPGCDVLMPIPATAVGGTFVADAPVYWKPGELTNPLVTIKAGNSARVLGLDASGQYYKIIWVCNFLWVPKATLGPNYDAVWHGAPLPTGVVK